MRVLVLGAGAVGGYFGGRLLEAGQDVTFLVRPLRAQKLAQAGLTITSSFGNAFLPAPACLTASELSALAERGEPAARFDLVILTCKAYDLEQSIADIRPAVGAETLIIPMLNGMRHLQVLDAAFGPRHVLGGKCHISARLNTAGEIVHLSNVHDFVYGERFTEQAERVDVIDPIFLRRSLLPSIVARFCSRCGRSGSSWQRLRGLIASCGVRWEILCRLAEGRIRYNLSRNAA